MNVYEKLKELEEAAKEGFARAQPMTPRKVR